MRIAFDTGGTFTDCVFFRDGRIEILKIPSTPHNPAEAISQALAQIVPGSMEMSPLDLACGTTVGTNALLQRRGGRVALVTTAGFEDVLEIGRQARAKLYNLFVEKQTPLVPRERRFGLRERLDYRGAVLLSPSPREIDRVVRAVIRSRAESVAICFLFSFINLEHERKIARALSHAGIQVSASHEILPEHREFERTSTTVVNAYLVPVMSNYLAEIERCAAGYARQSLKKITQPGNRASAARVRVMQSSGGILSASAAAREPVRTILSGPAGGILGAQYIAELAGIDRIITFDMGGTSTDVALLETNRSGALATTSETVVSNLPVAVAMLDIHTIGAGGGSLARYDRAGALRVGPESAGADPGPICYGHGEKPTVTDANAILGRIPATGLLGGSFPLDFERARIFMNRDKGSAATVKKFAQGIVDVANAVMEKAIRVISVERGHDPRDYTLVAFGGAGALHACDLAAALDIPRVLVPCLPGALSALGILRADVTKDLSRTVHVQIGAGSRERAALDREFSRLQREGLRQMEGEGFAEQSVTVERALDMRYAGQSYELMIPYSRDYVAEFHEAHQQRYGYADNSRPCEIVNVRARFSGETPKPAIPKIKRGGTSPRHALISRNRAWFAGRREDVAIYSRGKLLAGNRIAGPAIVMEYSATTLIPPGWVGRIDIRGNIILERRGIGPVGRS